ncbi:stage III sporulation protein AA [Clostridium sp. 29_15]|uniref:stage III sporulation protein AA n=1 Tax=Clostridium sp. 29_15 TaxID=1896982 RepID=UPI0009617543|nr:stage III sporulation protein AA [Clostridium sp. 29_15]OKZ85057.1 MAG: stage III sporulation protein AA [Clostridium sp. 29_15]
MDNCIEVLQVLPKKIIEIIEGKVDTKKIQEIRIKVNKPVIININNEELVLDYIVSKDELKYIITKISSYSLYAFEEEMKQGYITFRGGHRIGLAGQCVMENGRVKILRNISSINIRICKEIIGSSNKIMPYISNFNKVYNTLIVSPPKCGKTTILRDIAKNISNGFSRINLKGKKEVIIEKRSEIAGCYNGIPQMNVGIRSDVLDNCLKTNGIIMAIRSLSPEVIICDENMILTVHGIDLDDVSRRKSLKELINDNILERIVVLSSKNGPGTLEKVYKIQEGGQIKCLDI